LRAWPGCQSIHEDPVTTLRQALDSETLNFGLLLSPCSITGCRKAWC